MRAEAGTLPIVMEGAGLASGGVEILSGVDLVLEEGPLLAVMGPNGSGKTTLLKLAMGLIEPTSGTVRRGPGGRAAFVFQKPAMLRRSAAGKVAFALGAARRTASRADRPAGAPIRWEAARIGRAGGLDMLRSGRNRTGGRT